MADVSALEFASERAQADPSRAVAELLALPEEGRSRAAPRGLSSRSGTWSPRSGNGRWVTAVRVR